MTVRDLIEQLSEQDPDAEVRFMAQYSWPFEYSIEPNVWAPEPGQQTGPCDDCGAPVEMVDGEHHHVLAADDDDHEPNTDSWTDEVFEPSGDADAVVYLVEGSQLGYGSKQAWDR